MRAVAVACIIMFTQILCSGCERQAVADTSSRAHIQVVGPAVGAEGIAVVASQPEQEGQPKSFYFCRFASSGIAKEAIVINEARASDRAHKTFLGADGLTLGWIDAGKRITIASLGQGSVNTATLLRWNDKEGAMVDFWIMEVKSERRLFVLVYRNVDSRGQQSPVREYAWLYCFKCDTVDRPFVGKACLDDDSVRSMKVVGALSGDDVIIWQSVCETGSPIETVRCAIWTNAGMKWKERYAGNFSIRLAVDATSGSSCLLAEWKSPEDGSGIHSVIQLNDTLVTPVGSTGRMGRQWRKQLVRIPCLQSWAVVSAGRENLTMHLYDDTFTPSGTIYIDGAGIVDYVVAYQHNALQMVCVRDKDVFFKSLDAAYLKAAQESTRPVK